MLARSYGRHTNNMDFGYRSRCSQLTTFLTFQHLLPPCHLGAILRQSESIIAPSLKSISNPFSTSLLQAMPPWAAKSSPLHWQPFSDHPISKKLAAMKAAIDSGADPNELDQPIKNGVRRPELSIGRPLHYAIDTRFDHSRRHENLPVVELLLQHGADPRLEGMEFTKSAIDEIKEDLESQDSNRLSQENVAFFREALVIMQKKANELDGRP